MNRTKIEWVKNPDGTQGYTWNPITGCLNGCFYCYARKLANGRLRSMYLANDNVAPIYPNIEGRTIKDRYQNPFYPRFWPERLLASFNHDVLSGREKGMFVCDMGELFGDWIPEKWQDEVFRVIELFPEHRFYLLTKQPQNLIKFSPFPDNCWVGVSAPNGRQFANACIHLSDIKATVKYLSLEPFLEWDDDGFQIGRLEAAGINWVIIGAQTKPYKPPKIEWVKEITLACDKAGIPVFHKDNLKPIFLVPTNTLRQELPK